MTPIPYRADQELPAIELSWVDGDGEPYTFATGWTPSVKVCATSTPSTKTAGITLDDEVPNYVFEFTAEDFAELPDPAETGTAYVCHVYCDRDADGKTNVFRPGNPIQILLLPAPT